jgi:hypothetical protein
MAIWNILWTFGKFHDHLVHFVFIWYIFPVLVSCTKIIWQPYFLNIILVFFLFNNMLIIFFSLCESLNAKQIIDKVHT